MKRILLLAALGLQLSCAHNTLRNENHSVEILRDSYGTPHVYAQNNYGVYYGYGYVVAEDRLYQMEMLRRTVEGRVAEVLGDKFLSLDKHIRTSYDHRAISQQLESLNPEDREILQAYADGFNQRLSEVLADKSKLMPKEFIDNGFEPRHWSEYDVAMLFAGAIAHRYSDFNSELDNLALLSQLEIKQGKQKAWQIFNASKWLLDRRSPTTVPRRDEQLNLALPKPGYLDNLHKAVSTERVAVNSHGQFQGISSDKKIDQEFKQEIAQHGYGFSPEFSPASNYWAVGSARAKGAKGVLVNGPQFGWGMPSYVFGIGLHGGDFDVVGNTLLALPALLFAHNGDIAWGSTAGLSDQVDVYVEKLNPKNPEQYWHQGQYKNFDSWTETIKVKNGPEVQVVARRSVHGMVQQLDQDKGLAYSRARAWEGGELATLMAWVNLAKTNTITTAQQKIANVTTNINFYFMDKGGNIAYTHGGRYPQRAAGHDSRLPAPGDGQWDWQGFLPYNDNPSVSNPHQGYIANWNNRPAANWPSSDLWPYTWGRGDRNQLLADKLSGSQRLNKDQVWDINQQVSIADVSLPFLLPYLEQALATATLSPLQQQAFVSLKNWDQQWWFDNHGHYSSGATINAAWLDQLLLHTIKDDVGDKSFFLYKAINTPDKALGASMGTGVGVKAIIENLDALSGNYQPYYDFLNGKPWQEILASSFIAAIDTLQNEQGAVVKQWKLKARPMQWQPYNFRGVPQSADNNQHIGSYMNRGSENNVFVATGKGFIGFDVIPPGQSGFVAPDGKTGEHYNDQLEMFKRFSLKTIPANRSQMEQQATSKKVLTVTK